MELLLIILSFLALVSEPIIITSGPLMQSFTKYGRNPKKKIQIQNGFRIINIIWAFYNTRLY